MTGSTSSSDEALIADIVAAPDDDRPRLVYADFLQQRGDLRGELIAIQCALEVARARDENARMAKLRKEARGLLEKHELAWTAQARQVLNRAFTFRRGMIELVELDDATQLGEVMQVLVRCAPLLRAVALQRGLGALGRYESLERIDDVFADRGIEVDDLDALAMAADRSRLTKLVTLGGGLSDDALFALVELPHALVKLDFSLAQRPTKRVPVLQRLARTPARQHLRELRVRNPASLDDVAAILPVLPNLETLVVTNGSPTPESIQRLAEAAPQLVGLELDTRGDSPRGGVDLRSLVGAMPKLRYLRLEQLGVTDAQAHWLAGSAVLEQLARLDLSTNELGPGAVAICQSPHAAGLRRFRIAHNPLTESDREGIRNSLLADERRVITR